MKMPTHFNLGNGDIQLDRESQRSTPAVGGRPGGKHNFSYLIKPGLILAVFKHSGVEGEPWRGERKTRLVPVEHSLQAWPGMGKRCL